MRCPATDFGATPLGFVHSSHGCHLEALIAAFCRLDKSLSCCWEKGWLVGAVGKETTHAWHFNNLRSRARTEKEGLGSPWSPYCRRNAAFFPMMLRTTLRFSSRTALGIACV